MRARWVAFLSVLVLVVGSLGASPAAAATGVLVDQGTLDGAAFLIEIPSNWNHVLALYSHGYTFGPANPARDAGDLLTHDYLLSQGYALAGSSYSRTGWAIKEALHDQIALLDYFDAKYGVPDRTLAWGHSLGGMITAGLVERFPERIDAALLMCGVVAGGVGVWNSGLDGEFVLKTLVAPTTPLELVHITNPGAAYNTAQTILGAAQATPQGRARIALAAAVTDLPGWFSSTTPEPAQNDFAAREFNQFLWDQQVNFAFGFFGRAELEVRAGGNPSWNTGVDYGVLLDKSINKDEVQALYAAAGLDLDADLATLASAPRIAADADALRYLSNWIVYTGDVHHAVLTLHTTGDGLVLNQDEQVYAEQVRAFGHDELLRQAFVHRAGHCTFTPAETIAAFNVLVQKMKTHRWPEFSPESLNAAAAALGALNVAPPSFFAFTPTEFLRPFSRENARQLGLI